MTALINVGEGTPLSNTGIICLCMHVHSYKFQIGAGTYRTEKEGSIPCSLSCRQTGKWVSARAAQYTPLTYREALSPAPGCSQGNPMLSGVMKVSRAKTCTLPSVSKLPSQCRQLSQDHTALTPPPHQGGL